MKKFFKYLLWTLVVLVAGVISFYTLKGYAMYRKALSQTPVEQVISQIQNGENYVTLDKLPKLYTDSVVAVEDRRFYSHVGVDLISITRAVITDIREMELVEGGSTITQQIAKNLFFTQSRKLERKIAESFMAIRLECMYDKDEILEIYVNCIYFGSGYYSIREASLGYFGKEPELLTDYESTMLAGLPNAPSVYSLDNNPELASERQRQVIDKLVKYNYLTKQEGERIFQNAS